MYNLIIWLGVIIIALIVVFVAYAQVTSEIIKHYQKELKKEYNRGYEAGYNRGYEDGVAILRRDYE